MAVEPPDEELAVRSREGDREAFGALVVRHQKGVYNTIFRMTGNEEDARDLTQDAFIKAFRSISRFRGDSAFYTWVYRIAVNTVIEFRRKTGKPGKTYSLEAAGGEDDPAMDPPDDAPGPDSQAVSREHQKIVQQAINRLERQLKTLVVLRDIRGFSYDEIANILDLPLGTVKSRLHEARMQLKGHLDPLLRR